MQRAVRMKQGEIDLFRVSLLGIAAVGGMMAGTCGAIRRILSNGEARMAILIGYAFAGLSGGVIGAALGAYLPIFDVDTARGALLVGAAFGGAVVLFFLGGNLASVWTFRYMGMRISVEPDDPQHDRRRHDRRREDGGHEKTRD